MLGSVRTGGAWKMRTGRQRQVEQVEIESIRLFNPKGKSHRASASKCVCGVRNKVHKSKSIATQTWKNTGTLAAPADHAGHGKMHHWYNWPYAIAPTTYIPGAVLASELNR